MRVALVNVYNDSNRGSCALTWAALELLGRAFPGCEVTIVPIRAEDAHTFRHTLRRFPGVRIVPPALDGAGRSLIARAGMLAGRLVSIALQTSPPSGDWLRAIRAADLVVVRGGLSVHTVERSFREDARFLGRLLPLLAARRYRKPILFLGAQLGPFRTRLGRAVTRHILRRTAAVVARDEVSRREAAALVPAARVLLAADTAFALSDGRGGRPDPDRPTLAVVISSALRAGESIDDHAALFARAVTRIVESGRITRVLIVLQAEEDRVVSERLATLLGLGPDSVVDEDLDPAQLIALYATCRLVIASRLHGVILALVAGTPGVSVAPEVTFKERAVLETIGLGDLCVRAQDGPEAVAAHCLRVLENGDSAARIGNAVREAREALRSAMAAVFSG